MTFTEWTFVTLTPWPAWLLGLLCLLAAAAILLAWPATRRLQERWMRFLLFGLRAAAILLATLLLFEPAIRIEERVAQTNHVAILVDTSASMALSDGDRSRWDAVRGYLEEVAAASRSLSREVTFDLFGVTDRLVPMRFPALLSPDFRPVGTASDLGRGILDLKGVSPPPDAVYLISDGADRGALSAAFRKGASFDFRLPSGVAIHTVAVARAEDVRDIAIRRVTFDEFGFIKTPLTFDVELAALGFEPQRIPLTLEVDGHVLMTREIELTAGRTHYEIPLTFRPDRIGRFLYTVSVPVYEGETSRENNTASFVAEIVRDKVRVLHVCGRPSWDERFLRKFLKSKPDIDLISFFILRTMIDTPMAATHELSLIPFPKDELFTSELPSFDVVIFQNFDYRPYGFTRTYLENLVRFVRDTGGGFVMVGGDLSFLGGGYRNSVIEEILPVSLPPASKVATEEAFSPRLTEVGRLHPIMQLLSDPRQNLAEWAAFPPLAGVNLVGPPRPSATVLLEHPTLKVGGVPLPVVSVMEVGRGRTMAVATDALWFWNLPYVGAGGKNRSYLKFWENAIRWLVRDPTLERVSVEAHGGGAGEPVRIEVRVRDRHDAPLPDATLSLTIENAIEDAGDRDDAGPQTLHTDAEGRAETTFLPPKGGGTWRIEVSAMKGDERIGTAGTLLHIPGQDEEIRDPEIHADLLRWIARQSGGTFSFADERRFELDPTLKKARRIEVTDQKTVLLWNHFPLYLLLVTLLSLEWYLRRRWGLA